MHCRLDNKSIARRKYILKGVITELAELMLEPKPSGSYIGRISGSYSWKEARSELGCQEHKGYIWSPLKSEVSPYKLYCPYYIFIAGRRKCVAFGHILYLGFSSEILRFQRSVKSKKGLTYLRKEKG